MIATEYKHLRVKVSPTYLNYTSCWHYLVPPGTKYGSAFGVVAGHTVSLMEYLQNCISC